MNYSKEMHHLLNEMKRQQLLNAINIYLCGMIIFFINSYLFLSEHSIAFILTFNALVSLTLSIFYRKEKIKQYFTKLRKKYILEPINQEIIINELNTALIIKPQQKELFMKTFGATPKIVKDILHMESRVDKMTLDLFKRLQ